MTVPPSSESAEIASEPCMKLSQLLHSLNASSPVAVKQQALDLISQNGMAQLYSKYASLLPAQPATFLSAMESTNAAALSTLNEKLEDAKLNFGNVEIFDALLAIANHHSKTGNFEVALESFEEAFKLAVGIGRKLDILLSRLRVLFFIKAIRGTTPKGVALEQEISRAKVLLEEGADWERRNKLRVYEGIYLLSVRKFDEGGRLLLGSLATFTATEFMDYKEFVGYCVVSGSLILDRSEYKQQLLESPEILEVIHELPHLQLFVSSLYSCQYGQFLRSLAAVELEYLKQNVHLDMHCGWFVKEMRIKAYTQVLESYCSLALSSLAVLFGVGEAWVDGDLSSFIASGRIHAAIDKVSGIIETNRPDLKNAQYVQCIKQGDLLLNKVQKLSRVISA